MTLRRHVVLQLVVAMAFAMAPFCFGAVRDAVFSAPIATLLWSLAIFFMSMVVLGAENGILIQSLGCQSKRIMGFDGLGILYCIWVFVCIVVLFLYGDTERLTWGFVFVAFIIMLIPIALVYVLIVSVSVLACTFLVCVAMAKDYRQENCTLKVWPALPIGITGGVAIQTVLTNQLIAIWIRAVSIVGLVLVAVLLSLLLRGYLHRIAEGYKKDVCYQKTNPGSLRYQTLLSRIWNTVALFAAISIVWTLAHRLPARIVHKIPRLQPEERFSPAEKPPNPSKQTRPVTLSPMPTLIPTPTPAIEPATSVDLEAHDTIQNGTKTYTFVIGANVSSFKASATEMTLEYVRQSQSRTDFAKNRTEWVLEMDVDGSLIPIWAQADVFNSDSREGTPIPRKRIKKTIDLRAHQIRTGSRLHLTVTVIKGDWTNRVVSIRVITKWNPENAVLP